MSARLRLGALAVVIVSTLLAPTGPAHAEETPPQPEPLYMTTDVTVTKYNPFTKKPVSTTTYPASSNSSGTNAVAALSTGTGGTSTQNGCQRVTITTTHHTYLGFTAFKFSNWTYWCWRRYRQEVTNVNHGWTISDVDSNYTWRGIVNKEFLFYDYSTNDGHPISAFKNYRMGQFDNCVFNYGCVGTTYPRVTLRSYYNGTYAYETDAG